MKEPILRAVRISVRHDTGWVLAPCDFSISPGEVLTVYGPNGAGKSTLLQAVARLIPLAGGQVHFKGQIVGEELRLLDYHRRTAAVLQEPLLLRGSVWHNVTLGLRLRGQSRKDSAERIRPWLERLRIAHLLERSVRTLSAGEAHRTSVARALAVDPELLFLDEPFATLDAPSRRRLAGELRTILEERQIATLFVTHDLAEARQLSRRGLILDEGRLLQEGDLAEMMAQPSSKRVAEILGLA